MPSRVFTLEELDDLGVIYDNVLKREVYSGRWNKVSTVVFKADDDKHYVIGVEEGLTENQYCDGPDQYPDMNWQTGEIELDEVELYEEMVPVKKWRTAV